MYKKRPVAQWSEPSAHNRLVAGSSPAGPTKVCVPLGKKPPKFGTKSFKTVVLKLCGFKSKEIAEALETTEEAVNVMYSRYKNQKRYDSSSSS